MPIEHANLTSVHRVGHVSNSDPGSVGAYKAWIDTNTTPHILKVRNAGNTAWVQVGEILTVSNVGAGSQIYKTKTGQVFEIRTIIGDGGITVTQNANDITIGINPGALSSEQVTGFYTVRWVLTQSGTGNPTGFEVINDTANLISWSRTGLGVYEGAFDGSILPVGQTSVQVTYGNNSSDATVDGIIVSGYRKDASTVRVVSRNAAGAAADLNCAGLTVDITFPI